MNALTLQKEFDLFGCIQCGRCTGGCPESVNIRNLIYHNLLSTRKAYQNDEIWRCSTCANCQIRCPKGVKTVDFIVGLRSILVEQGKLQPSVRDALESIVKFGNPWGRGREKRTEWIGDTNVRILNSGEETDILFYVGCTESYDPRVQKVPQAFVEVMNAAGMDFGILGDKESCSGSEAKTIGEEGLFEMLVEENSELFSQYKFNKMVTLSPHSFNAFKNEYNLEFPVEHYTQVVLPIIKSGKLNLIQPVDKKVVFHDPCYLGKQNGIFDEPREILKSLPGVTLLEFDRSRETSMCCGGGGGRMWIEAEEEGEERLAVKRVKSAVEIGAEIIATACPFCLLTLEDAVKFANLEDKIQVRDILEITSYAMGKIVNE